MSTTLPLKQARISVILLSVVVILLFWTNNWIPLHQFSNFVLFLSNYPRSETMLLDITVCSLYTTSTDTIDISSILSISVISSKISSFVILNNLSHFDSASILFPQHWSVLLSKDYTTSIDCLPDGLKTINISIA